MTISEILTNAYQDLSTYDLLDRLMRGPQDQCDKDYEEDITSALHHELERRFNRFDALIAS